MKMKQSDSETQIYKEEDYIVDKNGHYVISLPEGTLKISTEAPDQKTGETAKTSGFFTHYFSSEIPQSLVNITELFKKVELLKLDIDELKKENLELKQRFDELYEPSEVIDIKELPDHKIEKVILKFLKKNRDKTVYPSDVAFEHNLDSKKVFKICQKLKDEGKIV